MLRFLLLVGGVVNLLFGLFHLWLGNQIRLSSLPEGVRGLMLAFDLGGTLFIFFFAYASFFRRRDLESTRLGQATLALCALTYWVRAVEELVLFSFTPAVFFSCFLAGAIYVAALLLTTGRAPATPPPAQAGL